MGAGLSSTVRFRPSILLRNTKVDRAYVLEQWLTEVVFYLVWKWTTVVGLLVFDAVILALTFVVIPFRIFRFNNVSPVKSLLLTVLVVVTSFTHVSVRPEYFRLLFIAIFFDVLTRLKPHSTTINWRQLSF